MSAAYNNTPMYRHLAKLFEAGLALQMDPQEIKDLMLSDMDEMLTTIMWLHILKQKYIE